MATKALKDAVQAHFQALFSDDERVSVKVLRNLQNPSAPRKESEIDGRAWVFLQFPPVKKERAAVGGGLSKAPWDEVGAFMAHVAVASQSGEALLDEIVETVTESLEALDANSVFDVDELYEGDAGQLWGGNFWGVSIGVPFFHPNA